MKVNRIPLGDPVDEIGDDGKPTGRQVENKITGFTYTDEEGQITTFVTDESKDSFEMTAVQASAAVATKGFEVDPASKSEAEEQSKATAPLGEGE